MKNVITCNKITTLSGLTSFCINHRLNSKEKVRILNKKVKKFKIILKLNIFSILFTMVLSDHDEVRKGRMVF